MSVYSITLYSIAYIIYNMSVYSITDPESIRLVQVKL